MIEYSRDKVFQLLNISYTENVIDRLGETLESKKVLNTLYIAIYFDNKIDSGFRNESIEKMYNICFT